MLGNAHRPGADHLFRPLPDRRGVAQLLFAQTGLHFDGLPGCRINLRKPRVHAAGVLRQKGVIKNALASCGQTLALGLQQGFRHPTYGGHIAAEIGLIIGAADCACFGGDHFQRLLRVGKALKATLAQGIKRDYPRAAIGSMTQAVQHPGMVRSRVLPEDKNRVGMVKIGQVNGAFTYANATFKPRAARLVAHI